MYHFDTFDTFDTKYQKCINVAVSSGRAHSASATARASNCLSQMMTVSCLPGRESQTHKDPTQSTTERTASIILPYASEE